MKAYSEKEILRMRIAAMKLYGSIPNIRIEIIGSDYWDLLITFINENLKFAVKVGGSTFISSNSYNSMWIFCVNNMRLLPKLQSS